MRYEKRDDGLEYKGHRRVIKTLGWWCSRCGEGILTGKPLLAHEKAFQELKADVDRALGPKEVTQVRRALNLTRTKAGELLAGDPNAFRKYESGEVAVDIAISNLLRLLAKDPRRLNELIATARRIPQA
jgi:HTH-type transcriptional regulator/antitoxin MqsA